MLSSAPSTGCCARGTTNYRECSIHEAVDGRVQEALSAVVAGIESGWFPNRPERPGWRMFVSCEYCEPDHLGTADRWAEWDRKHNDPRLHPWFGDPKPDDDGESAS